MASTSLGGIRSGTRSLAAAPKLAPPPPPPPPPTLVADVAVPFPERVLRSWNLAMFVFHTGLAATTLGLGNSDLTVPVFRTSLSFEVLVNGTYEAVTDDNDPADPQAFRLWPYYEERGSLRLVQLTAAFFLLSALFHVLNATVLWNFYRRMLLRCYTPTRWIEYAFSAPIMFVLIAYGLGMRSRGEFVAGVALVATTMFFGFWVEREGRPASPTEWSRPLWLRVYPWFLGHVPQVAAWLILVLQFYDNGLDSRDVPDFVHAILWSELVLFFSFGAASLLSQLRTPAEFYQGELLFQILSLLSKGLLGILLLSNVLMLQRFDELYESEVTRS